MNKKINIGIDIGGTKINLGLVKENGEIITRKKLAVDRGLEPERLIEMVSREIIQQIEKSDLSIHDIHSMGVGVPGTVDIRTGFVEYCPNLNWEDVPAGSLFGEYLKYEVRIAQDSRLAAWAEYLFGAGRNYRSMLCITLGTGIGCGKAPLK